MLSLIDFNGSKLLNTRILRAATAYERSVGFSCKDLFTVNSHSFMIVSTIEL